MEINSKTCLICKEEISNQKHFWQTHKMRQAEYYEKYFPKFDKFNGDPILFKTLSQYQSTEFLNKNNIKKWLKSLPKEEAIEHIKNVFIERKKEKGLKYYPSETEMTILPNLPNIKFLQSQYEFDSICKSAGLEPRYSISYSNYNDIKIKCDTYYKDNPDCYIVVDTREQNPFKLKYPKQVKKLDYGDYALSNSESLEKVVIERKSLIDFIGTMSGGYARFKKEIERAASDNVKIVVLIEVPINQIQIFDKLPYIARAKMKASPDYIMRNIRMLSQEYKNLDFVFAKNRKEAIQILYKILFSNGLCHGLDVQYAYTVGCFD